MMMVLIVAFFFCLHDFFSLFFLFYSFFFSLLSLYNYYNNYYYYYYYNYYYFFYTRCKVDETQQDRRADVQDYYGKTLQTSDDLKTNACCTAGSPPVYIQNAIRNLHPTTVQKYYGCGLCLPNYDLSGATVLDLGCGAGRDVYIAAQLVGATGRVVGVDMTLEQLNTAREFQTFHAEKFGHDNVQFVQGYLESLSDLKELQDLQGKFDVIISNCVINLCTDKAAVLKACFDLLKPGGELYFSDVYANRRVPVSLQNDKVLWGECLSGALYWNDFHNLAKRAGFFDPRLVEDAPITISNKAVQASVRNAGQAGLQFYSATYRLIKLDATMLEPACEDYGQAVIYKGTMNVPDDAASSWTLDKHHVFEQGRVHPVCGNTWYMLQQNARVAPHFTFIGDFSTHYGIFEGCGSSLPYDNKQGSTAVSSSGSSGGGGCC
jgi:arsenite methyltransferase